MQHAVNVQSSAQATSYSVAGLFYSPTPLGSIRIGHAITTPSGSHAIADDQFRVTAPLRESSDFWSADPLDAELRSSQGKDSGEGNRKLREIPIRLHVNDPDLVVQSGLQAFNTVTGQALCSSCGNGRAVRRSDDQAITDVECLGTTNCSFANGQDIQCKLLSKVSVQIAGQSDDLGVYAFRTSSLNSIKTFESKLRQFHALFGGRLRGVPFKLVLRSAQSLASEWNVFYYIDLVLDGKNLSEAAKMAKEQFDKDEADGLQLDAMAAVMKAGLANAKGNVLFGDESADLGEFFPASAYRTTAMALDLSAQDQKTVSESSGSPGSSASTASQISIPMGKGIPGRGKGVVVSGFALPASVQTKRMHAQTSSSPGTSTLERPVNF